MKNKARTDHHLFGGVTDVYLALMLSVFLLWPGTDGYTKLLARITYED